MCSSDLDLHYVVNISRAKKKKAFAVTRITCLNKFLPTVNKVGYLLITPISYILYGFFFSFRRQIPKMCVGSTHFSTVMNVLDVTL